MSAFLQFIKKAIDEKKCHGSQIINMDEALLYSDCPSNRTMNKNVEKSFYNHHRQRKKPSFTYVLACATNGKKLKLVLIFRWMMLSQGNFPLDMVIKANIKGWMRKDIMLDWLTEVWHKWKEAFFQPNGFQWWNP